MLVLAKNRRHLIGQVTSGSDRPLIGALNGRMNLGRNKAKTKNRRAGSGLKFHNFVANCSAVSHTNGQTSRETPNETTHCLKEEHGTKQITVSHWRKSANSSSDSTLGSSINLSPTANSQFNLPSSSPVNSPAASRSPVSPAQAGPSGLVANSSAAGGLASPSRTTRNDQTPFAEPTKSNKASKAKSFSLLSDSNPLISRSDFTLPHQPPSEANRAFIKNLIADNNSLQYFNGKQKHLNLKQSSPKGSHSSSSSSSLSFKGSKPGCRVGSGQFSRNSQSSGNQLSSYQLNNQLSNQLSNQLNSNQCNSNQANSSQSTGHLTDGLFGSSQLNSSQLANQLNRLSKLSGGGQFGGSAFNELSGLSSLNLQQSLDQINQLNLILNDNNLLKANESILSNLLIKEIGDGRSSGGRTFSDNQRASSSSFGNGNRNFLASNNTFSVSGDNQTNRNSNQTSSNSNLNTSSSGLNSGDKVKTSRRKPVFVRRLIKVDSEERPNCEQPLDLSLKKRKLSRSDEATTSTADEEKDDLDDSMIDPLKGKQSTNDCS